MTTATMVAITTTLVAPGAAATFTFVPGPGAGNPDFAPPTAAAHPQPISTLVAVLIGFAGVLIVLVPLVVAWIYCRANHMAHARRAWMSTTARTTHTARRRNPAPRDDREAAAAAAVVLRDQQAAHLARLREEGLNELGDAPPPYKKRDDDDGPDEAFELQPLPPSPRRPDTSSPQAVPPPVYEPFDPPPPPSPCPEGTSSTRPLPAQTRLPALPPPAYSDSPRLRAVHARMLRDLP